MAIFHHVVPPGGWKYKEERTNTTIVGMDRDDLIQSVKNHRKSNGMQEGYVEGDIEDQLSKASILIKK